jgi:hypothetical protein
VALASLVLGLSGGPASGAAAGCTAYASSSGNDDAVGNASHPFKTVARLLKALPESAVGCLTGRFDARVVVTRPVELRSASSAHATISGGITVESNAAGTVIQALTVHGKGGGRAAVLVLADKTTISGSTIDGTGYRDRNTACVLVDGARDVVIDGNRISSCTTASRSGLSAPGVFVGFGLRTRITNDLITHTSGYGVVLGPNAQYSRVLRVIVDGSAGGVLIDGNAKTASSYNVIENAIFSNLGGHGVLTQWGGVAGKNNSAVSNCFWHAFGGDVSGTGLRADNNIDASPQYRDRPADYTIQGGPCVAKRPSFLAARLVALPQFVVHFSLLALPKRVRIDGLQLTGVAAGDSVAAVCTAKCSGSFSARATSSSVQLHIVEKKWVPVGATIDIRVTKPGSAGAWARITVTGLPHGVSVKHACLAPGSTKPTSCGNFG